jgi:hypothetical protein
MKLQKIHSRIFENREELISAVMQSFIDKAASGYSEFQKDIDKKTINELITIIEIEINKVIVKKDYRSINLARSFSIMLRNIKDTTAGLDQHIQLLLACRKTISAKISSLNYDILVENDLSV